METTDVYVKRIVGEVCDLSPEERLRTALVLIINVAQLCTGSHIEAMGMLTCAKMEVHRSFTEENDECKLIRTNKN